MPIQFICPKCGKNSIIADEYAGQTGPCAGCGAEITIPLVSKPAAASSMLILAPLIVCLIVGLFAVIAIVAAFTLPAMRATQITTASMQNRNNLKMIGLALHNYHDEYKSFPPAYVANKDGSARTSWRILVLPYLQEQALVGAYHLDKNWDHRSNSNVRNAVVGTYASPDATRANPLETSYVLITGRGTAFEGDRASRIGEILNGTSNTAIAVRVQSLGIEWTEPKDVDVAELPVLLSSGKVADTTGMVTVLFADGSVRDMTVAEAIAQLPALAMTGRRAAPPQSAITPAGDSPAGDSPAVPDAPPTSDAPPTLDAPATSDLSPGSGLQPADGAKQPPPEPDLP